MKTIPIATAIATLAAAQALAAQAPERGLDWGGSFAFQGYTFSSAYATGIQSLTLATSSFFVGATVPGASGLRLSLAGNYADGTVTHPDGTGVNLSGLTDTEIKAELPIGRDAVVVSAIADLPTGRATQSEAQAEVAGAVAADLLPFRISNWGSGGAFGLATAVARSMGGFGMGLSAGYMVAREFQPLAGDQAAYRPGNELRLQAAVDRTVGRAAKASLQVTAQRYSNDALDGNNLYRSGNRLSVIGSLAFASGYRSTGLAYGGVMHRAAGSFLTTQARTIAAQDLIVGGLGFRLPLGRSRLVPSLDGRAFRTASGVGQGWLMGAGAALEIPGDGATLTPSLRGRVGSLETAPGTRGAFQGLEIGMGVRFGGRGL